MKSMYFIVIFLGFFFFGSTHVYAQSQQKLKNQCLAVKTFGKNISSGKAFCGRELQKEFITSLGTFLIKNETVSAILPYPPFRSMEVKKDFLYFKNTTGVLHKIDLKWEMPVGGIVKQDIRFVLDFGRYLLVYMNNGDTSFVRINYSKGFESIPESFDLVSA
jgi:hypothetical protein